MKEWGKQNMRKGGDDIEKDMEMIGVKKVWEMEQRRVKGYEIVKKEKIERKRVDVKMRI